MKITVKRIFSIRALLVILSVISLVCFLYQLFMPEKGIIKVKDFNLVLLLILSITSALLAEHGKDLLSRIKKVGPIELTTGETISQVITFPPPPRVDPSPRVDPITPQPLTLEEKLHYESLMEYLLILAARDIKPNDMNKSLKTDYVKALSSMGRYSYLNGEYFKSIKLYELLKEIIGDSPDILKNLAEAYLYASDYKTGDDKNLFIKKAIAFYEQYIASKNVMESKDYYNLGWAYDEIGLYEKAIENNLKAINIREDYFVSYYNIAASYAKWHKLHESLEWLEKTSPETLDGILDDPDFDNFKQTDTYKEMFEKVLRVKGIIS